MSIKSSIVGVGFLALAASAPGCGDPTTPTPVDPYPTPTILCPAAPQPTTSPTGQPVPVQYGAPSVSGGAPPVTASCTPASGSLFSIGTTKVTCNAVDARQRTATCGFDVVVQAAPRISLTQYVAFGDSITWGEDGDPLVLCGSNNNLSPYSLDLIRPRQQVALNNQYPMNLQLKLAARYTAQPGISVENQGKPGEAAGEPTTLTRFQQVLGGKRYDAVLLMEGTNDIFYGNDLTKLDTAIYGTDGASGLNGMLTAAKARGVRPFLSTIPPMVPGGSRACGNKLVVPLNDRIRALASAQAVTLVDVYSGMGSAYQQYIGPDGLHPNVAGFDNIATTFFNVLRSTLDVTPAPSSTGATRFGVPPSTSLRSPARPAR